MADAAAALSTRGVAHGFGEVRALDGVTLTVGSHERVALLGRNGSGKTTLLRIVSTLLLPDEGRVTVCGVDLAAAPDAVRDAIGVVFQSPALDAALTAREALGLQAALVRVPKAERAARIATTLDEAGLTDRADDRVGTFSGGMARRLDLSRGLLHRPRLALLDEPTTGLDPIAREAFWRVLDARRDDGAQIVATHMMDEAVRCDRVVILDAGRVVADDTPEALTSALGTDALWLDADDAPALADALSRDGLDARPVDGRVLVRTPDARDRVSSLYARPDVRGVSIQPPTLADVFAARVGTRPSER